MAAPVRPAEIEALIVQPDDSLAVAIDKVYVQLPVLLAKMQAYFWNSDGTIGPEFEADLCALDCQAIAERLAALETTT